MIDANDAFTVAERYRPTAINNVRSKSITAVVYFNSQCASTVPSALAELLVFISYYYYHCAVALDKLFTQVCLCHQAV